MSIRTSLINKYNFYWGRQQCTNIITNFKNKFKNSGNHKNKKLKSIKNTEKYLKDNPNLRVLKADKTNKTVIMYSQDYDKKMNELLIDKKTYKEIKTDLTKQYQKFIQLNGFNRK